MSIIVLLSPIRFFSIFSFFELSFINIKPLYILNLKGDNNYLPLKKKLTKVSTNNFKKDINGISDPLEMCKNIISA